MASLKISSVSEEAATTMEPLTVDMMAASTAARYMPPMRGESTLGMSSAMTMSGLFTSEGSSTMWLIMPVVASVQARMAEKTTHTIMATRAVRTSRMENMATLCCGMAMPTSMVMARMMNRLAQLILPPPVMSRRLGSMDPSAAFIWESRSEEMPPKAACAVATKMAMEPKTMMMPWMKSVHTEAR